MKVGDIVINMRSSTNNVKLKAFLVTKIEPGSSWSNLATLRNHKGATRTINVYNNNYREVYSSHRWKTVSEYKATVDANVENAQGQLNRALETQSKFETEADQIGKLFPQLD